MFDLKAGKITASNCFFIATSSAHNKSVQAQTTFKISSIQSCMSNCMRA